MSETPSPHPSSVHGGQDAAEGPPGLGLFALFMRFMQFGWLAWGGPVAQIAMLREQLVERERWVDGRRFNRVLGVYQALPGPEATELCIWFGQLVRGRLGGLVAGFGFMLPGLVLMLALTWAYFSAGPFEGRALAALLAMQVAPVALVARGAWKIGKRSLPDRATITIAVIAAGATLLGVHFAIVLVGAGLTLEIARRWRVAGVMLCAGIVGAVIVFAAASHAPADSQRKAGSGPASHAGDAALTDVAASGLRAGSLTFGGAYTVIPFLQHDAVEEGQWLSDEELLQGLALGSVLPAPLIIFAAFVGWSAAGFVGALVMTFAIFLPAFAITLAGHSTLERLVDNARVHDFLDGIMAGVVGLIAVTAVVLAVSLVQSVQLALILVLAVAVIWRWNSALATPAAMAGAAVLGALLA